MPCVQGSVPQGSYRPLTIATYRTHRPIHCAGLTSMSSMADPYESPLVSEALLNKNIANYRKYEYK